MRHLSKRKKLLFSVPLLLAAALAVSAHCGLLPAGVQSFLCECPLTEPFLPESSRFRHFTEEVFRSELAGNTLNLHYTVADPQSYGLEKARVTLGDPGLDGKKRYYSAIENYLSSLQEFDCSKLEQDQQLTYQIFRDSLQTELSAGNLLLYDEPLSPTLGIQAQLPILLAEYQFRTRRDIEDYLTLLSQIPDYFQSLLSYENTKSANGLFMSDECAKEVIAQCQEFIADPEENYLKELFNKKINSIANLSADEKGAYINQNSQAVDSCVIPSYQRLIDGLTTMLGTGTNTMGLYYYPSGVPYYEYLIHSRVGDSRSVEEIEAAVKQQMLADYAAIQELLSSYQGLQPAAPDAGSTEASSDAVLPDWQDASGSFGDLAWAAQAVEALSPAISGDPAAMLDELRQKITRDFPLLPDVGCEIKYVPDSLQKYLSPAFYLTPAIDRYQDNVIYINPSSNYSELELYTTLAHEGYPGHLFQSVYFSNSHPDLLRNVLGPSGYVEGWATYVEMYAYGLWGKDPTLAALSQRNRSFMLGLASLLDIGVHYRGYSQEQVQAFLQKLGFGTDTAASLYRSILEAPANYLQYYVGYLNFLDLREYAKERMGDSFSLKKYHTLILAAGPAPFPILKTYLEQHCGE